LVVPGLTACLRCVDLHRTDDTPRTPRRPPPAWHGRHAEETVLALVAAGTAVRAVTTLVDGRGVSIATTERFTAARPAPQVEHWPPHPDCGCHRLTESQKGPLDMSGPFGGGTADAPG